MNTLCDKCLWGIKSGADDFKTTSCGAKNNSAINKVLGPFGGCAMYKPNNIDIVKELSFEDTEHLMSLTNRTYGQCDDERTVEIHKAGRKYQDDMDESTKFHSYPCGCFIDGAKWADYNPKYTKEDMFALFISKASKWLEANMPYETDIDPNDLSGRDLVEYYDERQESVDSFVKMFIDGLCKELGIKQQ